MHTTAGARKARFARLERVFFGTASFVMVVLALDNLTYYLSTGRSIRGFDYLVVTIALAFLVCAVIARPLAKKLSITIVLLLIVTLVVELALSAWSLRADRKSAWYVWPPNFARIAKPHGLIGVAEQAVFTTNSLGIRGREFSADDDYRILCVGGSTTECLYLDDDKAWPHQLSVELAKSAGTIWVGNVGRSGTTALHHAVLLEELPEASEVDCWMVLCGINDLGQHLRGTYRRTARNSRLHIFKYRRPGLTSLPQRPLQRNLFFFLVLESLRQRLKVALEGEDSAAYQDVRGKWIDRHRERRVKGAKSDELPPLEPLLEEYETQLKRIIDLSKAKGARLVFATQPTLWQEPMPEAYEKLLIGGRRRGGGYVSTGALSRAISMYNDKMQKVCREANVECVDLATILPKSTEIFYDDAHFNESGARSVAVALSKALLAGPMNKRQNR